MQVCLVFTTKQPRLFRLLECYLLDLETSLFDYKQTAAVMVSVIILIRNLHGDHRWLAIAVESETADVIAVLDHVVDRRTTVAFDK